MAILGILLCALLFVLFGFVRLKPECHSDCGACDHLCSLKGEIR